MRLPVRAAVPLSLALTLGLVAAAAAPAPGTLEGTLLDARTGAPIMGAEVVLINAGLLRISDQAGHFSFGDFDVRGPDTVVIRHLSYDSMRLAVEEGTDLGPLDLELHLDPKPIELEGLLVEAAAERARTEARQFADLYQGELWERAEFERFSLTAQHVVDALRYSGMVLNIIEYNDGSRCVVLRARRPCAPVYLNGVRVNQELLPTLAPEWVESYVVLDPIQATTVYGTGHEGGAVVIYTRR